MGTLGQRGGRGGEEIGGTGFIPSIFAVSMNEYMYIYYGMCVVLGGLCVCWFGFIRYIYIGNDIFFGSRDIGNQTRKNYEKNENTISFV